MKKKRSYRLSIAARAGREHEVVGRTVSNEAYLSVKELLYARQALLPVDAQSRLVAVHWILRNGKDDRWHVVVVKERIDDSHLLGRGPYYSCARGDRSAKKEVYRGRALTTLILWVEVYVTFVNHLCTDF